MVFSVIVPVYNTEPYLRRCIDSILAQSFSDVELLLIDDGSCDQSGAICDEYARSYPFVQVFHQKNQGLSGARNTGLDHARGEWIAFADSDDRVAPEMLAALRQEMQRAAADMYSFNGYLISGDGETERRELYSHGDGRVELRSEKQRLDFLTDCFLRYQIGWEVWSRIYRREIIEKKQLRFVPTWEVMAEDYLFSLQYLLFAESICWSARPYYDYFQREDSLLHQLDHADVLPKLTKAAELLFQSLKREKMTWLIRRFDRIYFAMLDMHIQYMLHDMPLEEISAYLFSGERSRHHRRWLKKMKAGRGTPPYLGQRRWLEAQTAGKEKTWKR